jgi:16S rRNA (guanine966-N2)-methyltransferase
LGPSGYSYRHMRIIAGTLKGRKLSPIKGLEIRPTADRVRESIFNILGNRVQDAVVLDLFAGTGALGIEALSRGASAATFIDNRRASLSIVRQNVMACGLEPRCRLMCCDICRGLHPLKRFISEFNLVFMDPPYHNGCLIPAMTHLEASGCLVRNALIVVEHDPREQMVSYPLHFLVTDNRRYGGTSVTFLTFSSGSTPD